MSILCYLHYISKFFITKINIRFNKFQNSLLSGIRYKSCTLTFPFIGKKLLPFSSGKNYFSFFTRLNLLYLYIHAYVYNIISIYQFWNSILAFDTLIYSLSLVFDIITLSMKIDNEFKKSIIEYQNNFQLNSFL